MIARLALLLLALAALLIMGPPLGAGIGTGAGWGLAFLGAGAGIALVILAAGMVVCEYRSRQWAAVRSVWEIEQQIAMLRNVAAQPIESGVLPYAELTDGVYVWYDPGMAPRR